MSTKYTQGQENAILEVLTFSSDFDQMKKGLEDACKKGRPLAGFTVRELLSKARHLAGQVQEYNGLPVIYRKKVYETKNGEAPIRKAVLVAKIAKLLTQPVETVESLETATKSTLEILIRGIEDDRRLIEHYEKLIAEAE